MTIPKQRSGPAARCHATQNRRWHINGWRPHSGNLVVSTRQPRCSKGRLTFHRRLSTFTCAIARPGYGRRTTNTCSTACANQAGRGDAGWRYSRAKENAEAFTPTVGWQSTMAICAKAGASGWLVKLNPRTPSPRVAGSGRDRPFDHADVNVRSGRPNPPVWNRPTIEFVLIASKAGQNPVWRSAGRHLPNSR